MPIEEVYVPQMGEGLQEVVIIKLHKQPGDVVKRDEPFYTMETDKASLEVESPYDGVLREWLAEEGAVLPIGAPIARIEVLAAAATSSTGLEGKGIGLEKQPLPSVTIPPRTRAYCKERGISEEEMRRIPTPTGKLLPEHVDAYLQAKQLQPSAGTHDIPAEDDYTDRPLSVRQRTFIHRLLRSQQTVVPASARRIVEWGRIRRFVDRLRAEEELSDDPAEKALKPTAFQTFAYCVAQALKEHPRFRSTLVGEATVREYRHVNLGIAVALPEGELVTAVVSKADTLSFADFLRVAQERIERARGGEDQAAETTQFLLSYLGPYDILDATPVLVAPSVGVLFIGSAYMLEGKQVANISLTFDHRVVQGVDAALFLQTIARNVEAVEEIVL
ncbi:MAG TPA: 2-oxo acid dehydrogenase subunit E2 [Chthonomonas sp.]|uniref:2-oxo acid dehydrogenase subunit E2 n=1 Tax=Chthonomonas sp. TaxID=2282153 RepID=UPI002B4B84FA|nr:2-oxo acid dehydrogenase subunit E2 [Chthonomonas sp.]HLI49203.1 2-oxo acid dehydrogenase subunit E2 [Chthonomonas sp.]